MNGFILSGVLVGLLLAQTPSMVGQDAPAAVEQPRVEKLTEVEQLKLQLSLEKQKRIQAQYDAAINKCATGTDVRQILNESDQINAEQANMLTKAFAEHRVDSTKFKIDPTPGPAFGTFVPNK